MKIIPEEIIIKPEVILKQCGEKCPYNKLVRGDNHWYEYSVFCYKTVPNMTIMDAYPDWVEGFPTWCPLEDKEDK